MASAAPASNNSVECPVCSTLNFHVDRLREQLGDIERDTARNYRDIVYSDIKIRIETTVRINTELKKAVKQLREHQKKHTYQDDE